MNDSTAAFADAGINGLRLVVILTAKDRICLSRWNNIIPRGPILVFAKVKQGFDPLFQFLLSEQCWFNVYIKTEFPDLFSPIA